MSGRRCADRLTKGTLTDTGSYNAFGAHRTTYLYHGEQWDSDKASTAARRILQHDLQGETFGPVLVSNSEENLDLEFREQDAG